MTGRSAWAVPPSDRRQESRSLEVSHDPEPDPHDLWDPRPASFAPAAWPAAGPVTFPITGASPAASPFPEVGAFPEVGPFLEDDAAEAGTAGAPAPVAPGRSVAAKAAARLVDLDGNRAVPSVEWALSGPGRPGGASWRRRVKVVTGGQGPGQRDPEAADRDRARQPLPGPRLIAVLGCTGGAGQTVTALMAGHVVADLRDEPVAALDLNPGDGSLAARVAPVTSVAALLAGQEPDAWAGEEAGSGPARRGPEGRWPGRGRSASRLDVITAGPPGTDGPRLRGTDGYQRLTRLLAARYPLTMIDPAPSGLTRVLPLADQLVLVAPASPEAATSLANTLQWLTAHGYDELAGRAVTVVNGVSRRSMEDVLRAESVASGRGRAILRVPWDDLLSAGPDSSARLAPQTRIAYTALAGLLVAGLNPKTPKDPEAADPRTTVPGRSAGEHSD